MYINLHTHQHTIEPNIISVINCGYGFETPPEAGFFSIGLHPWRLTNWDVYIAEQWLRALLTNPRVIAIGEAGLDTLADTPWPIQEQAFELCIRLAIEFDLPLILHCVKAFDAILHYRKNLGRTHPKAWIIHGFDKHPQTAMMLHQAGFLLSFGRAILQANSHAAQALRQAPQGHFFLETDGSDRITIQAVYEVAAAIRGLSLNELKAQLEETFEATFGQSTVKLP
jgi:TatD DNase family protein